MPVSCSDLGGEVKEGKRDTCFFFFFPELIDFQDGGLHVGQDEPWIK
jgi:hypothetical protein